MKDNGLTDRNGKPTMFLMNLRKQLVFFTKKRGISASELARQARVPKQTVNNWLAGQKPKDVSQVKRVADVLGVSVDHICFGEGEEPQTGKVTDISSLVGDDWVGGLFELRIRRVKGNGGKQ